MTQQCPPSKNEKHVRLILDFTIKLDASHLSAPRDDEDEREWYARQKRLLMEILSNKEDFHRFLSNQIHTEFESGGMEDEIFYEEEIECEKLLDPPIKRLEEADQEYYKKAKSEDIFFEQVEEVFSCFSTELTSSDLSICDCEVQE